MKKLIGIAAAAAAVLLTGGAAVAQPGVPRVAQATCASVDLNIAFGRVEGAAGTTYREVVLTNRALAGCVLRGWPGVSYVDAAGNQVGAAAVRLGEPGSPLTLPNGASAISDVGFAAVDNFDPATCRKTPVWGVRVYPPDNTAPLYLPLPGAYGCAGDVSPFGAQLTVASVRS
ncbi:DUF4232 domain-containing protein [Saccharothrix syringae]|uniref:DUF4232 domain-containing protein n=1 Tax=Saccharothrix syringae TaxID=103733 RepID=A0A5Q0GRK7_SACSY|nr:DUF4232 domain-containing protein [Saccharothrix syringae]QFZ16511.1 DUF4232 domain-containing protein [Saccharothrix syringae]